MLEINTHHLKNKITKSVVIFSNDPKRPNLNLKLTATIKNLFKIEPTDYFRINIIKGDGWSKEVKIFSVSGKPFKITSIRTPNNHFLADFKPINGKSGGNPGYLIRLSLSSDDIPFGQLGGKFLIFTDLLKAVQEVRISGKIRGPITYLPERIPLFTDPGKHGGRTSAKVNLTLTRGRKFEITGVKATHRSIESKATTIEKGRKYAVTVTWPGKEKVKGRMNGTLTISTNHNDMPQIRIPYIVFQRGGVKSSRP
ncbi:MAG: hypothetical protein U9O82_07955 [Thermodesulfobacteriota bacterium]|nr:hypothetical protein [Thermodesulfobacteriota bacterium]